MTGFLKYRHDWIFCITTLAVWIALGWPFLHELMTGTARSESLVPVLWLIPFTLFGAAVLGGMTFRSVPSLRWASLCVQLMAVLGMAVFHPSDVMSVFLIIIAWQVAMAIPLAIALGWVVFQTLAIIVTLAQVPNPDLSYVIGLSFVLQLCFVFTAYALRKEAEGARELARTNRNLRSAQAMVADTVRDAERLRISRELHDAWGHELTALKLQLEIASNVTKRAHADNHAMRAKDLARVLLVKVRNAVATLRDAERPDLRDAMQGEHPRSSAINGEPRSHSGNGILMASHGSLHYWFFCAAALAVCLALGWPVVHQLMTGAAIRGLAVSALWLVPFTLFAATAFVAMVPKLPTGLRWILLCVQVAAVLSMAMIVQWAMMSVFLIITAWQAGLATTPAKALGWVVFQTLAIIVTLASIPNPDLGWVIGKSFALQLCFVFAAQALRMEAETGKALALANRELRSAQAIIASNVRHAERLRISRELHDAWGHDLTALKLQLEIASHVKEPAHATDHVVQAKALARSLLAKVRDVDAALREAERCDLKDTLETLAQNVPNPAIHVDISPGVRVRSDQAHALIRCAQEAVTNAVKHSDASNLWLQVTPDNDGVRLVARNDGGKRPIASSPGTGLVGMRERIECLGGRLAVHTGGDFGFTVDAWLPSSAPQPA